MVSMQEWVQKKVYTGPKQEIQKGIWSRYANNVQTANGTKILSVLLNSFLSTKLLTPYFMSYMIYQRVGLYCCNNIHTVHKKNSL